MDAADMVSSLKEVLITSEQLSKRTAELAAQIDADYAGRELLLVGVLKGAVMVMADLARAMHLPVEMDWMAVSRMSHHGTFGITPVGHLDRVGPHRDEPV